MTLGDRLDRYKGIGPGFDHLRIGLAISILAWHSFGITYGGAWVKTVPGVILASLGTLLPMFFGLSGFLIMGSALRTHNVRIFITFRVLRILPALFIEVVLSALVLGSLVTTLPLRSYFTDPMFFSYFGIIIGSIKYWLPGVFTNNPINVTNGALWTVGPEIVCYCLVAAMMLTGLFIRKGPMILLAISFLSVCVITDQWDQDWNIVHLPIKALVFSFLSGNLIYLYRYQIRYSLPLFVAAVAISVAAIVASQNFVELRYCGYLAAAVMPYCSAYIGLTVFKPLPFFHRGDYSYGIYIYGFPMQQAVTFYFPAMRTWWFNLALALPLAIAFAVASWHLVEKPVLGLRKKILPNPAASTAGELRERFTARKFATLTLIALYGAFVVNASRVFPLHAMYNTLTGHPNVPRIVQTQQF